MLKVFSEDATTVIEAGPTPILCRMIEREADGVPHVDIVRVWWNEEADRCRACPASECTFVADISGIGSCVVNKKGTIGKLGLLLLPALG